MSWALQIAGDAEVGLDRLDVWLHEAVLDELDALADRTDAELGEFPDSHLMSRPGPEGVHIVDLTLWANPRTRTLVLLGVDHAVRE